MIAPNVWHSMILDYYVRRFVCGMHEAYCTSSRSRSAPSSMKSPTTPVASREAGCWMNASTKRARTHVVSQSAEVVLPRAARRTIHSKQSVRGCTFVCASYLSKSLCQSVESTMKGKKTNPSEQAHRSRRNVSASTTSQRLSFPSRQLLQIYPARIGLPKCWYSQATHRSNLTANTMLV